MGGRGEAGTVGAGREDPMTRLQSKAQLTRSQKEKAGFTGVWERPTRRRGSKNPKVICPQHRGTGVSGPLGWAWKRSER